MLPRVSAAQAEFTRPHPRLEAGAGVEGVEQFGDPTPVGAQRHAQFAGGGRVGGARAEGAQDGAARGVEVGLLAPEEGREAGIAYVPFFPLGGGLSDLGGARIAEVAARHGATVPQIAPAWLLASSPVTLAIPGTGSLSHLEENTAAGSVVLTPRDLADLG
ncbi:hypothetical protein J2S50_003688 [Streptomyces sp. DSM 40167]|nr:hypothetical protein [Streptomyces sp. DSM 40167]